MRGASRAEEAFLRWKSSRRRYGLRGGDDGHALDRGAELFHALIPSCSRHMAAVSAVSRSWAMTDSNGWFDPKQCFPRVGSKANRDPFRLRCSTARKFRLVFSCCLV